MNDSGVHGATVTQFIDTLFQFTFLQLPPLYLHGWYIGPKHWTTTSQAARFAGPGQNMLSWLVYHINRHEQHVESGFVAQLRY
ncbi:Uncharacterized protein HZ326_28338 [Fusarium oxysporum f. sp. albedinis]|nr:Uncharacterized protein HZ326_28338 [Fusarium oxysporum f. sp. albedinis]